jgi:hypothetical protein
MAGNDEPKVEGIDHNPSYELESGMRALYDDKPIK